LVVQPKPQWLEYISDYSNIWSKSFKIKNKFTSNLAFRLYNELRNFDRLTPLAIEGLILEIIAETDRHLMRLSENRKPKWLGEVNDLLHSDFLEDLSLSVIAQTINIHPVHLARTFRKHYRSTIGEYLRNLRLEYACREISRSEDSLGDIALRAGFTDQSHFSRIFKRRMGVTPTEYRKNL
jgi:AraC family transcriptional regulator